MLWFVVREEGVWGEGEEEGTLSILGQRKALGPGLKLDCSLLPASWLASSFRRALDVFPTGSLYQGGSI